MEKRFPGVQRASSEGAASDWNSISPGIIPEVTVPLAHRRLWDCDAETSIELHRDQGKNPSIRLPINEIVDIPAFTFVSALVENPTALELLRDQVIQFTIGWFAELSLFNIAAHDDVCF